MRFRDPEAAALYLRNQAVPACERIALAEYGFALRFSDPLAMQGWCDAALIRLPPETEASVSARLYGYAGNAHRVVGQFDSAEQLLKTALELSSSSDPLLLEFWASFLNDTARLQEAAEALTQAAALRHQRQDPLPLASTLLQSAIGLDLSAKSSEAVTVAHSAIATLADHSPSAEGELLLQTALQNISLYLADAGRPRAALLVLRHSRDLLAKGGLRFQLRVNWLLARLAGALGDTSARQAFVAVRASFAAENMLQEVALVSLDLALHLLKTHPLEARAEVALVEPILLQLGIAESAEEFRLLQAVLASSQPEVELLSALSRALNARQRLKTL